METAYKEGDRIVYPAHGLGIVMRIENQEFAGMSTTYYFVHFPSLDMDILVPVKSADDMGIRPPATRDELEKALSLLGEKRSMGSSDWKQRQARQQELLKAGSVESVALLVNLLYNRQKTRDLPIQERKIFDTALSQMTDETGYVLGLDEDEAKRRIFSKLEKTK